MKKVELDQNTLRSVMLLMQIMDFYYPVKWRATPRQLKLSKDMDHHEMLWHGIRQLLNSLGVNTVGPKNTFRFYGEKPEPISEWGKNYKQVQALLTLLIARYVNSLSRELTDGN